MKQVILFSILPFILFFSCATAPQQVEKKQPFKKFLLKPDHEILDLRVPLYRPTTTRTETNTATRPGGKTQKVKTTKTYSAQNHPLCVNLGNGLLIDSNGVLFLSVEDLLNLDEKEVIYSMLSAKALSAK